MSCSLPMNVDDTELVIAHTSSGAEELAKKVPKARVASAFNTVPSEVLYGVFEARRKTTRPEPFALLVGQLAYERTAGPELAYRFERFGK